MDGRPGRPGGPTLPGWVGRRVGVLVGGVLALLALGPLLVRGYVLTYDMVFVPRLELTRGLLGLDTAVARAVPADLLVALASRLVPADLVQKLLLAGVFVGAAAGAARLVPSHTVAARAAAAALYAWNPFLYERLVMGHWGLLVSYAALPWVARAAIDLRAGRHGAVRPLVLTLAVAAAGSPAGGLIAATLALCITAAPPWPKAWRRGPEPRGATLAWIPALAGVPHPGRGCGRGGAGGEPALAGAEPPAARGVPVRPEGVGAFAARPDGPLGTVGSLVGLGGIWNALAVPPGVGSWPWLAGFAVVLAVAGAGLPVLWRRWPPGVAVGLLVAAGAGLVLAAAPALPGLRALVELVVTQLPGGGLVRDSQKFVAPLALVEAVCFGLGVERLLPALPVRWARPAAAGLVAAPVLLLPALAWGGAGRLAAVDYPPAFAEARAAMAADPTPGAVLVLPWHLYRPYRLERRPGGARPGPALVHPPGGRQRRPGAGRPHRARRGPLREPPRPAGPRRRAPRPGPAGRRGPLRAGVQGGRLAGLVGAPGRPRPGPRPARAGPLPGAGATGRGALPGPSGRPRGRGRPAGPGPARRGLRRSVPSFPTAPVGILRPTSPRRSRMSGLTLRALAALAAGALVLAFVASLVLVSSQNASSVSTKPLVVYGSR